MAEYVLEEPKSSEDRGAIPEDTVLKATLVELKTKVKENKEKTEKYNRLDWKFRVDDPDSEWDGRVIYGDTAQTFVRHEGCKLYAWAQMLLGLEFPPGFKFDDQMLPGNSCRIVVGARKYTKQGESEESVYNFVADVLPAGALREQTF